jgi:hypothetical protein
MSSPLRFCGAALTLAVMLGVPPAVVAATDPAALSTASLGTSLAALLGIPQSQIVEAKGYGLRTANGVSGVALGRYHESAGGYTFPALSVYHDCPRGTCVALLRLGQAATRLVPLALVDLDAPAAPVSNLQPVWLRPQVPQPASPPRWPVLLVASEPQQHDPSKPGPSAAGRSEQELYIISLKPSSQPKLLHHLTLSERWPEPEDAHVRPPRRVGHRVEGVVLGRRGDETVLIVSERDLDSRYSRGLRPQPKERHFQLVGDRFTEKTPLGSPFGPPP